MKLTDFRTVFFMKTDDRSCHLMTKNFQIKPANSKHKLHVKKFINMDFKVQQYSQATCGSIDISTESPLDFLVGLESS